MKKKLDLGVLQPLLVGLNGGSHGVVLVIWRVGVILGNGYGIQGQNYVAT